MCNWYKLYLFIYHPFHFKAILGGLQGLHGIGSKLVPLVFQIWMNAWSIMEAVNMLVSTQWVAMNVVAMKDFFSAIISTLAFTVQKV